MFNNDQQPFWYRTLRVLYFVAYGLVLAVLVYLVFYSFNRLDLPNAKPLELELWDAAVVIAVFVAAVEVLKLVVFIVTGQLTSENKWSFIRIAIVGATVAIILVYLAVVYQLPRKNYCWSNYHAYRERTLENGVQVIRENTTPSIYPSLCEGITLPELRDTEIGF